MKEQTAVTPTEAGLSLEVIGQPVGAVRDNDWPCIKYKIRLMLDQKPIIETNYHLGVGHVKPMKGANRGLFHAKEIRLSAAEEEMSGRWAEKPSIQFIDKQAWASLAAKLAIIQKVSPSIENVVSSLLLDASGYLNHYSFEDWCGDYGYDTDSRKAHDMWLSCEETGRNLARNIGQDTLDHLLLWAQDY